MTVQMSVAVRNAELDAIETTIGTSAVCKIRTGAQPANCAAADSGTVLATMALPSNWMADAASGAKGILGTWQDLLADNAGTAGHWRIYASDGTTCGMQGSATSALVGTGDMLLDNAVLAANQQVNVVSFTLTAGNA